MRIPDAIYAGLFAGALIGAPRRIGGRRPVVDGGEHRPDILGWHGRGKPGCDQCHGCGTCD